MVGAGLLGLSTARALARRGWRVIALEAAATVGHRWSGSKGDARIFRLGYPDPLYVEMARRAQDLWRGLEVDAGCRLLHRTGQLTFGDAESLEAIATALASCGAPAEQLSPAEATARFGTIRTHGPVLFEPESGVLVADECLRALCRTGRFELRTDAVVTAVHVGRGGTDVVTADGLRHHADVVVACAGPRSLRLLGLAPAIAAAPSLPQVAYFRPAGSASPGAGAPVFIEWGDAMIYGLPVPGGGPHAGLYKLSHHTTGTDLDAYDPTGPEPDGDDPALLASLTAAAERLLPGLQPEPVATERCMYDNSADGDFIMDRVGPVVVGCATSGHGFKFGPLLGELLADLAEGSDPALDLGRFGLDREAPGPGV